MPRKIFFSASRIWLRCGIEDEELGHGGQERNQVCGICQRKYGISGLRWGKMVETVSR